MGWKGSSWPNVVVGRLLSRSSETSLQLLGSEEWGLEFSGAGTLIGRVMDNYVDKYIKVTYTMTSSETPVISSD